MADDNRWLFTLEGHGSEQLINFEDRKVLPANVTVVTFSKCGDAISITEALWPFKIRIEAKYRDGNIYNWFNDPSLYKNEIEEYTGMKLNIYRPGDAVPALIFHPYSNFYLNQEVIEHSPRYDEEGGEIVLISGIHFLFNDIYRNKNWAELADQDSITADTQYGPTGSWVYSSNGWGGDEPTEEGLEKSEIVVEVPFHAFMKDESDDIELEYIQYSEILVGEEYEHYKETGEIPKRVYDYIYQGAYWYPAHDNQVSNNEVALYDFIDHLAEEHPDKEHIIYWNVCRDISADEHQERVHAVRSQSYQQQEQSQAAYKHAREMAAAENFQAFEQWGHENRRFGGRRKTYRRKNLRKTRKTKQRWTRTKHSRSRRL